MPVVRYSLERVQACVRKTKFRARRMITYRMRHRNCWMRKLRRKIRLRQYSICWME